MAASYGQLGRIGDAKNIGMECTSSGQECVKTSDQWREFWGDYVHFREAGPLEHLLEGLDKAGLVKH